MKNYKSGNVGCWGVIAFIAAFILGIVMLAMLPALFWVCMIPLAILVGVVLYYRDKQ